MQKTTREVWDQQTFVIRVQNTLICTQKHKWGLEPIDTSNSDARQTVLHAQNHRWGLGTIETINSGAYHAVLHTKNTDGVLYPQRLVILVLKALFWMHKTTGESWNQHSLFIVVLSTLFCVLKTTDEVWDPCRPVSQVQKSLFCRQKQQMRAGTHRD